MTDLLYIVSRLRPSGPTNQLYYLLKYLDNDFNTTVLTLSPEPEDTELPRFQELDIEYETLGLSRIEGIVYGPPRLRSFVDKLDPDIVHTQGIRADTLSALLLSDYPRVTTIRNYPNDDYPAKFGRLQGNAMAWEHLQVFKRLDHPIACSETISKMVEPHGIDATPIQNGVDHYEFTPVSEEEKIELRRDLGLPESDDIIVSVGSLIPRKDPITIIKGYEQSDLKDSTLVFLGDGPLLERCEDLSKENESIHLEGEVDNVVDYLQASDYFVSASRSEGLPNSVMEALSSGLPVCLSDINPHNEILQYNSEVGIQFDCGSESELNKALVDLIQEDDVNSDSARQIAKNNLSAERMSDEYQTMYNKIQGA